MHMSGKQYEPHIPTHVQQWTKLFQDADARLGIGNTVPLLGERKKVRKYN